MSATPTPKRAAIYCRVSTTLQAAEEKTSLQHQEQLCRERAADEGLAVAEDFVVHDASSGSVESGDRTALQRLLQAAEHGAFDVVLMDLIDRTSRGGIFEFVDICQRFLRFEVTPLWASDRSIDLTTQTGQLIAAAKAWGAHSEKEAIVRRFSRGRQDRIARGQLDRATIPYGYRWTDNNRVAYEADPVTAPIVQRLYEEIAAGQSSATKLAEALEAAGVPTPGAAKGRRRAHPRFKGKPPQWTVPTIAAILRNPVYKGERAHNRYASVKRSYKERRERDLKTRRATYERDPAHWTVIPVPPLISAEVWAQAQHAFHAGALYATKVPNRYTAAEVLLYGGYIRCAHCGYAMSPNLRQPNPRGERVWYYHCGHREPLANGERCPGASMTCAHLDALVWREAVRLIQDPQRLRQLLHRGTEVWSPQTQLTHYTELLRQLDAADQAVTQELLRLSGKPGLEQIRAHLEQQAIRNAELRGGYQQRLAEAQETLAQQEAQTQRVTTFAAWAAGQAATVTELTADEQRDILIHSLHPTIYVARVASDLPRVSIVFAVSAAAAQLVRAADLSTTAQWRGAHGEYYTVFAEEFAEPLPGGTLDLTEISSQEVDRLFAIHA